MRKTAKLAATAVSLATLFASASLMPTVASAASAEQIAKGKEITFNRKTGNCLACHMVDDGVAPGNLGPPLIAMKARFPDRAALFSQIADATIKNPSSRMPPFGKHKALSDADIDAIIDYLYTL